MTIKQAKYHKFSYSIIKVLIIPCFILFTYFFIDAFNFAFNAHITTGKVISIEEVKEDNNLYYYPVVEYKVNGSNYNVQNITKSNTSIYSLGESVEVLFLKDNPIDSKINSFLELWMPSLISFLAPLFTFLVARYNNVKALTVLNK